MANKIKIIVYRFNINYYIILFDKPEDIESTFEQIIKASIFPKNRVFLIEIDEDIYNKNKDNIEEFNKIIDKLIKE